MTTRHVVLVGHCSPDAGMLRSAVGRVLADVRFTSVNDGAELASHRGGEVLWLVNRALDGSFDHEDGIALIARHGQGADAPICMLVSNFPEAQAAAVAVGARPGFGKSALYLEATKAALLAATTKR